jgi:hypothetical protein
LVVADLDLVAALDRSRSIAREMVVSLAQASRSTRVRTRKWVVDSWAEQNTCEDVGLAVADVDAVGRLAQQARGAVDVLQPTEALLVLDWDAGGVDRRTLREHALFDLWVPGDARGDLFTIRRYS